jgi:hypothetical protein
LLNNLTKYYITIKRGFSTTSEKKDVASLKSQESSTFFTLKQPTE